MAQITWEDDEIKKPATVITWEDEEPTAAAPPPEPAPAIQPQPGLMDSIGNMAGNVGQTLQGLIPTSIPTPAPQTMPVTPIVPQRSASEEIYYPEGLQPPAGAESPFTQPTTVGGPSREAGTFAERAGQKLYTAADVVAHGADPIFHGAGLLKTVAQMGRMLSENMTVPVGENLTRLTGVNINPTQKWKDIETYMSDVQQKRMGGIEGGEKEWVDAIQSAANNALMMVVATPMAGTMAKLGMLGEAGAAALKAGKSFIPTTLVLSMMGAQKAGEDYARGRKENMTPLTAAGMGIWGALNEVIPELGPQYMLGKLIPGADAVFKSSAPMQKIANWMAKFAVAEQGEEQLTNVMDNIKEVFLNTKEAQNYALENPEFAAMNDAEKVMYMTQKQFLPTVFQTAVSSLLLGGFGRAYGNAMQKSMEKEYYSTTPLYRVPADYLGTEEYATASTAFQSQPEVLERFLDQKMGELVEKWNTYNPEKKTTWAFIKDQMTNDMTNLAMEQMRQAFQGWQQQTNAGWTRGVESPIDRGANQQMRRETTAAAEGTKPQAPPTETIVPTAPAVKVEPTKPPVKQREPQYEARLQEIRDNGLDSVNKIKKFYAERDQFYSNADARRMRYEAFGKEPTAQMQQASEQVAGAITAEDLAETAKPLPTKAELDLGKASEQVASGMSEEDLASTVETNAGADETKAPKTTPQTKAPQYSTEAGIGKRIGNDTYVHVSAIEKQSPKAVEQIRAAEARLPEDFTPTVVRYNLKDGSVSFMESSDFDTNTEPTVERSVKVLADGTVGKIRNESTVYHRKFEMVDPTYEGFDINEAKARAAYYEKELAKRGIARNKIGSKKFWDTFREDIDGAQYSVEQAGDKVNVSEQGDLLSKPLENRTRNIAGTTFVRAVDDRNVVIKLGNGQIIKIDESNKTLETDIKGRRIKGYFEEIDGEGVIKLAQNAQTGSTLDHELFHAAFLMALNPKERETILNDFKDAEDPQEAAAIHYEKRKYLDGTLAGSKYLRKMADFFSDLARNWLGYTSTRNTMRAIAKGEPFARKEIQSRADLTEPKGVKERLGPNPSDPQIKKFSVETYDTWSKLAETAAGERDNIDPDLVLNSFERIKAIGDLLWSKPELMPAEDKTASPIRTNVDYGISDDIDTDCPRGMQYRANIAEIEKRINRILTPEELMGMSVMMKHMGKVAPCIYCYVESARRAWNRSLESFKEKNPSFNPRDFQSWYSNKKGYTGDGDIELYKKAQTYVIASSGANVLKKFAPYSGELLNIKRDEKGEYIAGYKSKPKINKKTGEVIVEGKQVYLKDLNARAGVRGQSSTDFKVPHIMELMQSFVDMSILGLKSHFYTKEPNFVKIFGNTGAKINMSVFCKTNDNGTFASDDTYGMNWNEAKKLRKKFPNAGIIMVTTDDANTRWAMKQNWIDQIIPVHHARMTKAEMASLGMENYSGQQSDEWRNPKEHEGEQPPKLVYADHLNDFETYKNLVERYDLKPRFEKFFGEEGYMKLVNDVARTDTEQQPVMPYFDYAYATELIKEWQANNGDEARKTYTDDVVDMAIDKIEKGELSIIGVSDLKDKMNPNVTIESEVTASEKKYSVEAAPTPKMKGIPEGIAEEGKVKQWYPQGIANLEARGNDTQRVNTYTTYEKMAQLIPNIESAEGLDLGAGLHVGASLLTSKYGANLETVEPEPAVNEQGPLVSPDYSYSSQVETKSKDYIVSNQVLNVLEPDIRDGVVDDIGRILKDGGVAIISARGFSGDIDASVKNPNNKPVTDGTDAGKAVWVRKTDRDAKGNPIPGQYKYDYQRGFDGNELVNYIQERLGTDFEVKKQTGLGKSGVVIRKKSAKQKVVKGKVRMMVDEFIASEGGFARLDLGLGDLFGKNAREDKIVDKLLQETDIDPEFEKRRAAARGITPPSLFDKFKENAIAFYKQMTQHFSTLDFKKHASLGNSLRVLESGGDISSGMAYRAILGFTKGLTPAEYKIFEDNIILPDLIRNIEEGLYDPASLPFDADYTNLKEIVRLRDPQTLLNTASRQLAAGTITQEEFDDATAGIQKVADALAERNAFMGDLRDRLVDAGFLPPAVRNDDRYFHRQVLEHYNVKAAAEKGATGAEVKNPKYGMMKARTGSIKEYNQNYLESEREVLSQMINTMRTYDFLQKKVKALDVSARVRQFAMDNNISVDEAMKDPQFKDYVRWSPEKGDKFYKATSVSEDVLDDLLNSAVWNASGDMTVDVDALNKLEGNVRTVLAKRPAEMWVIPADVAATLDAFSMPKAQSTVVEKMAQAARSTWKGAAIMGPLRAIPYMINNTVGDADIVIAYNTAIFKKVPEAMSILWNADYKNARYQEAMNQAVIDSGSSARELADISKDAAFSYIQGNGISLNVVKNYQQAISNLNKFRENTLRLAAYLHFVEQTEAGKTGIYAASDMSEIDQITDPKERAAKLARDLMVDYGNTSEVGNVIAKYMIPFYRWMEGNAPRYYRLLKNAPFEGNSGARILAAAGTKAGIKLAWTFLKFNMISQVLYRMWHAAISGDDDDETAKARAVSESKGTQQWVLGKTISRFLFPNDIDEITRSLRVQGAFGDVVKTFTGSDNWVDDLADLYYGSTTYGQKAKELGLAPRDWLDLLNAPVIKGYASASFPFTKMFVEQAMGKQFNRGNWNFKDMRPMRDRAAAIAGNMGVAPIYERLAGIPRAGSVGIGEALTYKTNLGEVAYNETRNLVKDFMESKGVPASFGAEPRESDNAWYNYKRAQKLYQQTNDPAEKARHLEEIRRYFGEYQNLKAQEQAVLGKRLKPSDIKKKLEKASENADPLAQLPKKLRPAFIESLSKNDKDKLKEAIKYYNQTLRR